MAILSGEAVLISALLNSQDVRGATSFGISEVHFIGYKDHYVWLQNFMETYAEEPSWDAFMHAFPDFRTSDHTDIRSACDMVYKGYNRRAMQEAMSTAVDFLGVGDEAEAYATLVKAEPRKAAPKPKALLTDASFLDTWDAEYNYVELPYRQLQVMTGGIQPGNLWYLAARPGQGKTAHLSNIVKHAVTTGSRVLFYSLEMSEAEVRARFHASLASHWKIFPEITLTNIRNRSVSRDTYKEFMEEVTERLEKTGGELAIHTPRDGMVTPSVVGARADEFDLNVIDYIGLMKNDMGQAAVSDWRVAAQISNQLKEHALAKMAGVLCAAQINREGESGKGPPKVVNLAQSDALGQDGDVVVTMRNLFNVATHFSLEKNRHGTSGVEFFTEFNPNQGLYPEITPEQAENLKIAKEASA